MQTTEESKKTNKGKRLLWLILLIISIIAFTTALVLILVKLIPPKENFEEFKKEVSSEVSPVLADNPIDFEALNAENPDVCAWIMVDGTVIDYPIMRGGADKAEDFYLDHDIYGKSKRAGAIYIQRLNTGKFTDKNTVIYGHNMLNGTMFAALKKYRNKQFFNENQTVRIYTPGHIYTYKIFAAFVYDDRHLLNSFNFGTDDGYQAFLDECFNPPTLIKNINPDITVTPKDRIITLSTCTSAETERYLVTAVLTDDTLTK